ncbi:Uncharacterised protein [Streptococcus pneumoniae]|nr:Uncharacterised protein [Streptococcus pneumoniae]
MNSRLQIVKIQIGYFLIVFQFHPRLDHTVLNFQQLYAEVPQINPKHEEHDHYF